MKTPRQFYFYRLFLTIGFAFCFFCTGFSQVDSSVNVLQLKNYNSEEIVQIEEGKLIKVWSKQHDKPLVGRFSIESESSIILQDESVSLKDIHKIKLADPTHTALGILFIGQGIVIYTSGILLIDKAAETASKSYSLFYAFVGTLGVGIGATVVVKGIENIIASEKKWKSDLWGFSIEQRHFPSLFKVN